MTPFKKSSVKKPTMNAGIIPNTGPKYGITLQIPAKIPINTENCVPHNRKANRR